MSVYTPVDENTLKHLLKNYSLGDYKNFENIIAGTVNSNFFVTTTQCTVVLTLFETLNKKQLEFYIALLAHLNEKKIPIGYTIKDNKQQVIHEILGKPAVLFKKLTGVSLNNTEVIHCKQIGELIAKLHLATNDFNQHQENPFSLNWYNTAYKAVHPHLDNATQQLLDDEFDFFKSIDRTQLPQGTIHADIFRDNVFFDQDKITGIIDFYFACTDTYLYDVGILLLDWCIDKTTNQLNPEKTHALLHAYNIIRPFSDIEKQFLPKMLRISAFRFWMSRLYSSYTTPRNEQITIKNPDEFKTLILYCRDELCNDEKKARQLLWRAF